MKFVENSVHILSNKQLKNLLYWQMKGRSACEKQYAFTCKSLSPLESESDVSL